jgi:hypothetical protein
MGQGNLGIQLPNGRKLARFALDEEILTVPHSGGRGKGGAGGGGGGSHEYSVYPEQMMRVSAN